MNLILSKVLRFCGILYLFVSFVIFNDKGVVAVRGEDGAVFQTGVFVANLPQSDQYRINAGIDCGDVQELTEILENFIS